MGEFDDLVPASQADPFSDLVPKPIDFTKSLAKPGQLDAQGNKPYTGHLSAGPFSAYQPENMQEAVDLYKSLGDPAVAIPRLRGTSTLGKLAAAPVNVASGLLEGLESPVGIAATLAGGPVVKGLFAGLAAKEAGRALGEASVTKDQQSIAEGVLGAGLAPWMALHGTLEQPKSPINANEVQSPSRVPVEQQSVPVERPPEVQAQAGTPQRTSEGEQALPQPAALPEKVTAPKTYGQKMAEEFEAEMRASNERAKRKAEGTAAKPTTNLPSLIKTIGRDEVDRLVGEWDQNAELHPDGKSITTLADPRSGTGKVRANTKDFLSWYEEQKTSQATLQPAEVPKEVAAPDLVGMGGALKEGEIPETGAGGEKYGISQRLREERAQAGQVEPVEPGTGTTGEKSVARGNELLNQGFDAPKALADFEQTGAANPDSLMAIRQYGERLFATARKIEQEFGTDSDQYREAFKAGTDWDKRSKPIATVAHKLMVAHQGETDLDTGSYTGLARAWVDATGEEFTPKQKATAEIISASSSQATEAATKQIGDYVGFMDKAVKTPIPEQAALAAAAKTVREATAAMADAENKIRVAQQARQTALDGLSAARDEAAVTAATEASRKATVRLAAAENKARVASTEREKQEALAQVKAEQAALATTSKVTRENAVRISKEESVKRVAEAKRQQDLADIESTRAKKALEAATNNARRAAIQAAKQSVKDRIAKADLVRTVWEHVKTKYLDKGRNDPGDIFTGTATDLGMSARRVREILGSPQGASRILNEVYKKLADQRRIVQAAKVWLKEQERPGIERFVSQIPRVFFIGKIFGHGTALHVTHSATQAFNPYVADIWWKSFAKQWPFAYKPGYAEMIIRDTMNDPNYLPARRYGLDNDFTSASGDYQAATSKFKGVMRTLSGSKGTDGLKVLRQDIFNRFWDRMPQTLKTDSAGRKLAISVNHATGSIASTTKVPQTLQWLLFAPKLEGSRWGYSYGDSIKDGMTVLRWSKASAEDRHIAKLDMKQKAAIAGVYFSLLTANQGLLTAGGSKQKINFLDPTKSDWLSFKAAGHKIGVIGPMIGEVRFLVTMLKTGLEARTRRQARRTRTQDQEHNLLKYGRGKLSPMAGDVSDVSLTQSDFQERPLPWSSDKAPAYMRRRGQGKYTYPEYAISQLPIPFEEAAREAWAEQGVDEPTIKKWLKVISTGTAALTGARVSKDYNVK